MANRYSVASGLASSVATWDGGASVPGLGDRVLITQLSTGARTFSTNTAGYAIGATAITLTGSVLAGSYVVGEAVQFGTDPNYYTITAWNNTTKVLTVSALIQAIPAAATVVVCCGHVVELDGAYTWGDDLTTTITINTISTNRSVFVKGTLVHSRTVNSSLTGYGTISIQANGGIEAGTVGSPMPVGVTATIYPNRSAAMVLGKYNFEALPNCRVSFVGASRKRWTTLTTAAAISDTSLEVADATGWQVGDVIHLVSDNHGTAVAGYELLTIAAGYVSGDLTVPLVSAITKTHRNGLPLGNLTTNVVFRSYSATLRAGVYFQVSGTEALNTRRLDHVKFEDITGSYPYQLGVSFSRVDQYLAVPLVNPYASIDSCVFTVTNNTSGNNLDTTTGANPYYATQPVISNALVAPSYLLSNGSGQNLVYVGSQWALDGCLLSATGTVHPASFDSEVRNSWYVGCNTSAGMTSATNGHANTCTFTNCNFSGTNSNVHSSAWAVARHTFEGCDIGYTYPLVSNTGYSIAVGPSSTNSTFTDCKMAPRPFVVSQQNTANLGPTAAIRMRNRNSDVTLQEDYFATNTALRDNAVFNRGRSSINIKPTTLLTDAVRSSKILCAAGASIRVVGYVRADTAFYNGGGSNWTPPTVTISGLGITPVVFTASSAANNAWEKFDLTATNSSASDGELDLSYTTNPKLVTTGSVYFDGVPEAPFITKVRHYGFVFDEASVTRTVNAAVHASEATAAGYSGVTVAWGTSTSPVTLTADQTFQTLYDYTQYQSVLPANSANAVPITGVGVAGSPSLFAQCNATTTGYTLNGGGSLSMGSYTLTGSVPWNYTYTGGTFSQASVTPAFSGGTLAIGDGGTYTFTMGGSTLVTVNPSGSSSYTLSAGSFTGTLTVNNLQATPVTVYIPAGVTTSTTGNTGGAITFSAPTVQQSVTITNVVAGSRVQIYDTTNSVELFNGTSSYSWTDPSAAVAPRDIRVRIAYVNGTSAKTFVEANIGTCGTTAPSNAVTYLASQVDDPVYNSNAVDGSTVTGITIVEGATDRVQINVAGGTVPWRDIYAYQCYWLFDATGIQDDGAFISAPDTANYILTGFKIKNTHGSVPLVITDGYGVDSTGSVTVLYDTTGTSIFPAPEHVVAKVVSVGGANIITGDIADIPAAVLAAAVAAPIHSNIMKVNTVTVTGNGQPGTEWGP